MNETVTQWIPVARLRFLRVQRRFRKTFHTDASHLTSGQDGIKSRLGLCRCVKPKRSNYRNNFQFRRKNTFLFSRRFALFRRLSSLRKWSRNMYEFSYVLIFSWIPVWSSNFYIPQCNSCLNKQKDVEYFNPSWAILFVRI